MRVSRACIAAGGFRPRGSAGDLGVLLGLERGQHLRAASAVGMSPGGDLRSRSRYSFSVVLVSDDKDERETIRSGWSLPGAPPPKTQSFREARRRKKEGEDPKGDTQDPSRRTPALKVETREEGVMEVAERPALEEFFVSSETEAGERTASCAAPETVWEGACREEECWFGTCMLSYRMRGRRGGRAE
ncbi:hypothetical protein NDU88_005433 [Pleurodeles waltl]|uniref:Uncharacterized protein n=1 Tax=Pleurodeles waltl TaxID=8319 RepID=A0AAV7M9Y9_PLEWA|nr:hypothetical protein NDU88_005433 [Pleurodeles waltl]